MEELLATLPLPTFQQFIFAQVAIFVAVMGILVVVSRNLFHSALSLVGALFGVAGIYVLLEAEFLAVSQILVYVGGISTLIAFAIMLTRSMMYGDTAPINRQAGTSAIVVGTLFSVLAGLVAVLPWPGPADSMQPAIPMSDVAAIIAGETSLRILVAEDELVAAEALVVDSEAELESALSAEPVDEDDVVRAEEDLAEVQAALIEAEEKLARAEAGVPESVIEEPAAAVEAVVDEATDADAGADAIDAEQPDAEQPDTEVDIAEAAETGAKDDVTNTAADLEGDVTNTDIVADTGVADTEEPAVEGMVAEEPVVVEVPSLPLIERGVKSDGEVIIAGIGQLFVTTYLVPFEVMALLLLVVLAGAIMLARDRN